MCESFLESLININNNNSYELLDNISIDIHRSYNLILLIRLKYYIKNLNNDHIKSILLSLKYILDYEYFTFFVNISSLVNNNIFNEDIYNIYKEILKRNPNNDDILIKYFKFIRSTGNLSLIIETLWNQKIEKLIVLQLLSPDMVNILYEDNWNICIKNLEKAEEILECNDYKLESEYQCFVNQMMLKSYFDINTREYSIRVSECYRKYMPFLNYNNYITKKNNKLRIGYISSFFHLFHSVFVLFQNNIKYAPDDIDVFTFFFEEPKSKVNINFVNSVKNPIFLNINHNNLESVREIIASYKLDIIIYPEIVENSFIYYLAHSRLAPMQITSFGYCDTSGISTIDYYISSDMYEPENGQDYYSEKLIKLNNLGVYIEPDYINIKYNKYNNALIIEDKYFLTKTELGFDENTIILSCIQTELKITENFIKLISKLLEDIPNSIILFKEKSDGSHINIKNIVKNIIPNEKVYYVKTAKNMNLYHNYIYISDLLLTPFPFGGFFTSLDGFQYGKPVITLIGNKLMGRFTYGFYKYMGIMECVATNEIEYIEIIKKFCSDKIFYKKISEKIYINKDKLYYSKESLEEWYDCLKNLYFLMS